MLKNLATLLIALVISLVIGEMGLRIFTVFPINMASNRVFDTRLGYRLTPGAFGFDSRGFRNPERKQESYTVAAIGDSQTYGNNVLVNNTWPAIFEKITGQPTYNFGVGSYGVFSYHPLVRQEINRGKHVIVALHPGNDFVKALSYCEIDITGSKFWSKEVARLGLSISNRDDKCDVSGAFGLPRKNSKQLWWFLKYNSALMSALNHFIFSKLKDA